MKCPFCTAEDTKVVDTRPSREGFAIRRRRQCQGCGTRFNTTETVEVELQVRKRDRRLVPFDADKLAASISKACAKRPLDDRTLSQMVARIETQLSARRGAEIESHRIGELALRELREYDQIAYLRFKSVYDDFKNPADFRAELDLAGVEG